LVVSITVGISIVRLSYVQLVDCTLTLRVQPEIRNCRVARMQEDAEVTRAVEVEAGADQVWELLADPELRGAWLDDDDALDREVRIDDARPGESLTWTWWRPDDEQGASQVAVVLTELATGGTRIAVTERLVAGPVVHVSASAGVRVGFPTVWDRRLLGLELLLVAAGALVR
jgi:uncharacterized protein YndB with AHSA1/START domain